MYRFDTNTVGFYIYACLRLNKEYFCGSVVHLVIDGKRLFCGEHLLSPHLAEGFHGPRIKSGDIYLCTQSSDLIADLHLLVLLVY